MLSQFFLCICSALVRHSELVAIRPQCVLLVVRMSRDITLPFQAHCRRSGGLPHGLAPAALHCSYIDQVFTARWYNCTTVLVGQVSSIGYHRYHIVQPFAQATATTRWLWRPTYIADGVQLRLLWKSRLVAAAVHIFFLCLLFAVAAAAAFQILNRQSNRVSVSTFY